MTLKKELPRWLSSKTARGFRGYSGAGGGALPPVLLSPQLSSPPHHRIPCSFLILRRCTLIRLFLLMLATMFVSMNVFVNSRGYSNVLDYCCHRVPRNVPLQMDILVPLYQRDDTLRVFGEQLGHAIRNYLKEEEEGQETNHQQTLSSPSGGTTTTAAAARDVDMELATTRTTTSTTRIKRFRLLLTRYPTEKQDEDTLQSLKTELSGLTSIPPEDIVIIKAGSSSSSSSSMESESKSDDVSSNVDVVDATATATAKFERASAVNLLQRNACHLEQCLVARMDADMTILPIFFHNAIDAVYLKRTAYFPIVWSEYYPKSVQLVEEYLQQKQEELFLANQTTTSSSSSTTAPSSSPSSSSFKLDPLSEHRGYWRKYGTGMYCLSGLHAQKYQLEESFKGWGGEDGDFYTSVRKSLTQHRVTRQNEPGLIHRWHAKFCLMGVDVHDNLQWKDCLAARMGQMGSELGLQLLREHLKENMPEEYQHQSIMF